MSWADLPTVKEILGHREIEMTAALFRILRQAVERLGEALSRITTGGDE